MVITNMHANINIISQKSEHVWQEPLYVVPFDIQKPEIKHANKTFGYLTTHGHIYTYKNQVDASEAF